MAGEAYLASKGCSRPPDPLPLVLSTYSARCQTLAVHLNLWNRSYYLADPPLDKSFIHQQIWNYFSYVKGLESHLYHT